VFYDRYFAGTIGLLGIFPGTSNTWSMIEHHIDSIFDSGVLEPNDTFSLEYLEDGIFPYYDSYRPDTLNGVVVVEEPPGE
jgi:hypothetical protein